MRLGNRLGKGVIALACATALSGVRIAAGQSEPALAPPPAPEPPPARPEAGDRFADPAGPAPEQSGQAGQAEGPRAGTRRNMIWDRVAQQRLESERQRLEAEMRRLEAERQRLEAELRRAQEAVRRSQQEGYRNFPGPQNPGAPPAPMPRGFGRG